MPEGFQTVSVQAMVVATSLLCAVIALTVGLILVPKRFQITFLKRMAVVGVIAPFGLLLTIGWIGFLIWVSTYSIMYLAPSSVAIAAAISGLRVLGVWVCQAESKVVSGL